MNTLHWNIEISKPPLVTRYCKKCGKPTHYQSSGLFRINAQRKALDIWLIYRCTHCQTTWNFTLASRIRPDSLPPALLERFHQNDSELALQYACNTAKLRQQGAQPEPFDFAVLGELPTAETTTLHLHCALDAALPVHAILRQKLNCSHRTLELWEQSGQILTPDATPLKRLRLLGDLTLHLRGQCPSA